MSVRTSSATTRAIPGPQDYMYQVLNAQTEVALRQSQAHEMSTGIYPDDVTVESLSSAHASLAEKVRVLQGSLKNVHIAAFAKPSLQADVTQLALDTLQLGKRITQLVKEINLKARMEEILRRGFEASDKTIATQLRDKAKALTEMVFDDKPSTSLMLHLLKTRSTLLKRAEMLESASSMPVSVSEVPPRAPSVSEPSLPPSRRSWASLSPLMPLPTTRDRASPSPNLTHLAITSPVTSPTRSSRPFVETSPVTSPTRSSRPFAETSPDGTPTPYPTPLAGSNPGVSLRAFLSASRASPHTPSTSPSDPIPETARPERETAPIGISPPLKNERIFFALPE